MSWVQISKRVGERLRQPWFGGGGGALLAVCLGLVLLESRVGKGLRDWSYDLPFVARAEKPNTEVVVIYLDEQSYRDLQQAPADFERALHAQLVQRLKAAGARMIVFDMLFIDVRKSGSRSDSLFAQAMREDGKVILGAQLQQDELGHPTVFPPVDALRDACAGWGLAYIQRDPDFAARQHHPGTEQVPSLGWKAAELFGAKVTRQPESRANERWLNYYSREPFAGVSYSDVLQGRLPPGFTFKNKVVFIGAGVVTGYFGEEKEQFRSPWTWINGHFHLGVEVNALTFTNLVHEDWLTRPSEAVEILVVIITGLLLGYGLSLFRPLAATGAAILFALIMAGIAYFLFVRYKLWFSWLIPVVAQAPLALGWSYLFYAVKTYLETKLLETSLALYLSPHQAKQILKQPELLKPGAKKETTSILFSDTANFSKSSQRMEPNDLVQLLNNYYEAAIGCIHQTDGTVVNLVADAILAIWNAPQPQSDHQERACRAALLLNQQLVHFQSLQHEPSPAHADRLAHRKCLRRQHRQAPPVSITPPSAMT